MAEQPTIEQRLTADMKAAMKAGEKERLTTIRMILSDVQQADMNDTTPEKAVDQFARKARKAKGEYEKYGDADRAAASGREVEVAESYLPKKADAGETDTLVDGFLAEHDFGPSDVGRAMGQFMKAHGDKNLDAAAVNKRIREKLT